MTLQTKRRFKRYKILYLLLLPPLVSTFIFHYVPFYGIAMAFQNYKPSDGIFGSEWVGLKHFENFVNYPYFWRMLKNTLVLSFCAFVTFPLPIIVAIMLNEVKCSRLRKTSQTILYAPHFISTVVVCAMALMFIKQDGGLINVLIEMFGGEAKDWISYPETFPLIYTLSGLWTDLGWGTILYTSALATLSHEQVEAARIDGANRFQVIWNVYLPHLKPTIIIKLIMQLGAVMSVGFEKVYLLQNPLNFSASSVISTYAYEVGLIGGQYSYSAAIGLFNNIINVILVLAANFIAKKLSDDKTGLW